MTKDNTLALSGTVSDPNLSSLHVFDGATDLGAATISGGTWSFTTSALTDGGHSFTAKATDSAGNFTITPAVTATVDTTNPNETISSTIGTDTGATTTISSGGLTRDNTLALSGTVSDANLSSVHVFDGATDLGAATISGSTWSFTTSALTDGGHSFIAKATDTAGNVTTTAAVTATVDTAAPVVAITTTGGSTNQSVQTIAGTVDVADIGTTVTLFDNGSTTPLGTAVVQNDGSWSTIVTLSGGSNSLTAKDTDAAGNTGTSNPVIFTLATVAPTIAITSPVAGDNIINKSEAAAGVSISGTAAAGIGGAAVNGQTATITIVDGSNLVEDTYTATVTGGAWSVTVTAAQAQALADGSYTIKANVSDAAGNAAVTATLSFTLDTTAAAPSAPDMTAASDSGSSNTDNITSSTAPTFTGTAEAGSTVTIFSDGVAVGHGRCDHRHLYDHDLGAGRRYAQPDGEATDTAGNTSVASSLRLVGRCIDTAAPAAPTLALGTGVANGSDSSRSHRGERRGDGDGRS